MRRLLFPLLLLLGLGGCKLRGDIEQMNFVILVEAKGNDFRPVEGVIIVGAGNQELSRTNGEGRALFTAVGREGESVEFLVQPPPGLLVAEGSPARRVILKRLRSLSGSASAVNLVDATVRLRRKKLPYVVLLATNQFAGLPVAVLGAERTKLNSRGVGMFLHEGMPGDELTVTLLTSSDKRIAPESPNRTFVLPDTPSQLFWRQNLSVRKVNLPAVIKKGPKGPKRTGPKEI